VLGEDLFGGPVKEGSPDSRREGEGERRRREPAIDVKESSPDSRRPEAGRSRLGSPEAGRSPRASSEAGRSPNPGRARLRELREDEGRPPRSPVSPSTGAPTRHTDDGSGRVDGQTPSGATRHTDAGSDPGQPRISLSAKERGISVWHTHDQVVPTAFFFFFFITLKPRVE